MKPPSANQNPEAIDIDRHFARFIGEFGGSSPLVEKSALLLSQSIRQGHICLNLEEAGVAESASQAEPDLFQVPDSVTHLQKCPAFGLPDGTTPIVVTPQRLYLRRYWDYEQSLARAVLQKARRNGVLKKQADTQEAAVAAALQNYFTIISGGPGTGKTTTVLQILRRFLQQQNTRRLRIALAAPTGKAAARLQELLRKVQEDSQVDAESKKLMPRHATTIHRLLGWKPDSVFFRYDSRNPLPLDLLVIDEASMVALPLMAKLFDALLPDARVLLLGDRDQLASVEPGAVLADMAESALTKNSPLRNALITLSRNYRFGNENAIYRLSSAVRSGDVNNALQILNGESVPELASAPAPKPTQLAMKLERWVVDQYKTYLSKKDPAQALADFQRFRVLCALREGPYGVKQVNSAIEEILHKQDLISDPVRLYSGMPILVMRNDYQTRLFNGDVGIVLPDPTGDDPKQLWAWFIGQDNQIRRLSPGRLPDYERAYAMTVHKAQGSEFERILFLLPERDSPVLTRELIYTGVTRASQRVEVWFNEEVLRSSVARQAERRSGLREALMAGGKV